MKKAVIFLLAFCGIAFGWYYDITFDASDASYYGYFSTAINYSYVLIGRKERGILQVEIKNLSDQKIEIENITLENGELFQSLPDKKAKWPVFLPSKSKIDFFSMIIPEKLKRVKLKVNDKVYVIDLTWIEEKKKNLEWKWTVRRIYGISNFFFWFSVLFYIIKRVKLF